MAFCTIHVTRHRMPHRSAAKRIYKSERRWREGRQRSMIDITWSLEYLTTTDDDSWLVASFCRAQLRSFVSRGIRPDLSDAPAYPPSRRRASPHTPGMIQLHLSRWTARPCSAQHTLRHLPTSTPRCHDRAGTGAVSSSGAANATTPRRAYSARPPRKAYVALGSNMGDRVAHIERACSEMDRRGIQVKRTSGLWETKPMYVEDQAMFVNGACEVGSPQSDLAENGVPRVEIGGSPGWRLSSWEKRAETSSLVCPG